MKKISSGVMPIIQIDRRARAPLHRQIYNSYRTAIVEGALRPGERIPSTRILASELGLSRIPVLNAYAQLLAEGYLEARVGAGTVVSSTLPDQLMLPQRSGARVDVRKGPRPMPVNSTALPSVQAALLWFGKRWGAFNPGQPALDHFPFKVWSRLVSSRCRNMQMSSMHYDDPRGSRHLREVIAAYLRTARGVRCESDNIMIVSGSQQALEITTRVLLDRGSRVWIEDPGYRFARNVFQLNSCEVVPIPVDEEGMDVAVGIKRFRKAEAALVTPSHQYPLGATMSASRRLQLLDWAHSSGSWIIEDDYDSEYRYENLPIASLQGLDPGGHVIYIGTFSKVLFSSLRLGYVVIPPELIERFMTVRLTMDLGASGFLQPVLADFIEQGHFSRHLRRMRQLYRERRSALLESLRSAFDVDLEVHGEHAGLHVAVMLPPGFNDHELSERAARAKLWLVPLSSSYLERPASQGFIMGFSNTSTKEIPNAMRKLRDIIHSSS